MSLGPVADDGHFLCLDERKVCVVIVIRLCHFVSILPLGVIASTLSGWGRARGRTAAVINSLSSPWRTAARLGISHCSAPDDNHCWSLRHRKSSPSKRSWL